MNRPSKTTINLTRGLSVLGMFFPIYANFIPPSNTRNWCFLLGGLLMVISPIIEQELFFALLQFIIITGAAMAFVPASLFIKASVPIVFSIITVSYLAKSGYLKDKLNLLGSLGILVLATGYAVSNPWIYLAGGALLATYSFIAFFRGVSIAIIWAILNTVFAIAALTNIYRFILN